MSKICYGRGYVHTIQHHLTWYVLSRHDSFIGQMDKDVKDLLNLISDDKALYILDIETHNDYVHL
ncbi:MAG: transposase [Youngiibacter sp.]|nr:transposase [Youngiibacter sp.]